MTKDVLLIKWVDSSFQHGWRSINEFRETLAEIVTVGILVKKDRER